MKGMGRLKVDKCAGLLEKGADLHLRGDPKDAKVHTSKHLGDVQYGTSLKLCKLCAY